MIIWLIVSILSLWILKIRINRRKFYKLASLIPKSKDELAIIGLTHKFLGSMESTMNTLINLSYESMEQNSVIRCWIGPCLNCVITNPDDLEFLLKTSLGKDDLHQLMKSVLGNGVIFSPVNIWRTRRKFMVPAFSARNLERVVDILYNKSETLASVLESKANGKSFSMWPYLTSYTFDSVCESTAGMNINTLNNENYMVLESTLTLFELISERVLNVWLRSDWLYRFSPQYEKNKKCLAIVTNFANKMIAKVRTDIAKRNNTETEEQYSYSLDNYGMPFIDVLIKASGGVKGYSDVELREDIFSIMAASTDTSAVAIGNVLKLLAKYPEVQEKLYDELYQIFEDSDRVLEKKDLIKLRYMTLVIKETLRLLPPAPFIERKILEDVTLPSGTVLPAGANVFCSILAVQRDPRYWGPNAEHFDPDRFLPERFNLTHACSYIPFSYGPRNCVGFQYGMMSVKIVLATILRRFRVVEENTRLLENETGPFSLFKVKFDITMKDADGYQIALEKRIVHVKTPKL